MDHLPTLPAPDGDDGEPISPADFVTISRAELDALRKRAEGESLDGPGAGNAPPARGRDGQQLDGEFAARDQRLAELERACKAAVRDRELATALAGKPLVSGAAAQLIKLWRDDFDVYEGDGGYKVAAGDGRTVAQVVGEWLASPEYSHFCLPTSRGGTGARDANRPAGGAAAQAAPKNLGEAIVMRWREESATRPNNFLKPVGLRRHR